jgi:hypothetical protein
MATEVKPIERVEGAFSSNPVYDELGHKLAELAAAWRTHKTPDLVQRYQNVLGVLLELGWKGNLDFELQLPREHMPQQYMDRRKRH